MKRGRKDVYAKHECERLRAYSAGEEISSRTVQARFYQACSVGLLHEATDQYPELERIFQRDRENRRLKQKPEILEQLGRMWMQDGYREDDVITVARTAADALGEGYTVKEVKAYIIHGRKTGEW